MRPAARAPASIGLAGLALAGLALAGLAACAGLAGCDARDRGPRFRAAGAAAPRAGGTLRLSIKDAVRTLDPAYAYDDISYWPLHAVLDTLVDYAPGTTRLEPRLAERWERSADGRTYRFYLREGLRYADGAPIVAADFARALERVLALPDSPFQAFFQDLDGATDVIEKRATACRGVRVLGERQLELQLARPCAALPYLLAMKVAAPLPAGLDPAAIRRAPPASGPYRVAQWREGERLELERNPYYRDPARQRPERIAMLENVPRDVQLLMFERGELELAERLSAADLAWLQDRPDWAPYVHTRPTLSAFGARMDVRRPPFDDRRVRQALNYAIDKDHITRLLARTTTPAHGMLPPGTFGRDDALPPYPHDPARARALLAAAGYGAGLVLPYTTLPDEEAAKVTASMQADLAAVGVRLEVSVLAFPAYLTAVGRAEGGLAFSYTGWVADYPDPGAFFDPRFHSSRISADGSSNDSFYGSPELDRVLDAARAELDEGRRAALYRRAERILYDDAPWIWGYHQLMTEVAQPYVRGYTLHPVWLRDLTTAWLDLGDDGAPVPR